MWLLTTMSRVRIPAGAFNFLNITESFDHPPIICVDECQRGDIVVLKVAECLRDNVKGPIFESLRSQILVFTETRIVADALRVNTSVSEYYYRGNNGTLP